MFGFVTINEQDLEQKEIERYRQVYCGVCRALHKQTGQLSRLTLNHDLAFMALVHMSLYEPVEETGLMRCPMHPIDRRLYTANSYIDYAANMTVVMAYHKLMDNWHDDRHRASYAFAKALEKRYESIKVLYPRQCRATEDGLAQITELERAWDSSSAASEPDAPASLFGGILAEVFVVEEDMWAPQLRAFGYELGRFVYMMDAAMDLPDDVNDKSYNPFFGRDFTLEETRMLLMSYMAKAAAVFERLPIVEDANIIRSVLYAGVWQQFNGRMQGAQDETGQSGKACQSEEESEGNLCYHEQSRLRDETMAHEERVIG